MRFDPATVPFSHPGAWTALSIRAGQPVVRCLSGRRMWQHDAVFRVELVRDGVALPITACDADAGSLRAQADRASLACAYDGCQTLRLRATGAGLRLVHVAAFDHSALAFPCGTAHWRLNLGGFPHFGATAVHGMGTLSGPRLRVNHMDASRQDDHCITMVLEVAPDGGCAEIALTNHLLSWQPQQEHRPFAACVRASEEAWQAWNAGHPAPEAWSQARDLASYLTWSCQVAPRGFLRRWTTLSSKNHMHAIWAWDTAFFAAAMARHSPDLAWDHLLAWFDALAEDGAQPNILTDVDAMWGFTAPQLFGWAVRELVERAPQAATPKRLAAAVAALQTMTRWFLDMRSPTGLPEYHHGNDGGQDNASCFDIGMPVLSPDLAAYLVLQLDVLADCCRRLGRPFDADDHAAQADMLLGRLVGRLWDGKRFRVPRADDGAETPASRSVIPFMPLVLGRRLPPGVSAALIADLLRSDGQLGPHGLMSEHTTSPYYVADGYWRGPVWSPPTLLIARGLADLGATDLARAVASRWAACCVRSGFAENFNAISGAPQRDQAMPWASAIWLLLVEDGLALPE